MSGLSAQYRENFPTVLADLEQREMLFDSPSDLPLPGALVRLHGGLVGEIIIWLEPNPNGTQAFSAQPVALVALRDSRIEQMDGPSHPHRRAATRDEFVVLRNIPSDSFAKRWLTIMEELMNSPRTVSRRSSMSPCTMQNNPKF